jgi:hypothetical protein
LFGSNKIHDNFYTTKKNKHLCILPRRQRGKKGKQQIFLQVTDISSFFLADADRGGFQKARPAGGKGEGREGAPNRAIAKALSNCVRRRHKCAIDSINSTGHARR